MKPKLLLRIASIVIFIHAVLHTLGHLSWKNPDQPERDAVVSQMVSHKFAFMGSTRSMADYFDGYGFAVSLALGLIAYLLWIAGSGETVLAKKIMAAVAICLIFLGIEELIYFFALAGGMTLFSALLTGWAFFISSSKSKPVL